MSILVKSPKSKKWETLSDSENPKEYIDKWMSDVSYKMWNSYGMNMPYKIAETENSVEYELRNAIIFIKPLKYSFKIA